MFPTADQGDRTREEKVDALCDDARKRGVEIIRDKTTLVHGDRISRFMR
jgi:internalin A